MAKLSDLIVKRKVIRKKVAETYNKVQSFSTFSTEQRISERNVLLNYKSELARLNDEIFSLAFLGEEGNDDEKEKEITSCVEYFDKIEYCLPRLEFSTTSRTVEVAKSLLKQPTAPLPKFASSDGEDFIKFISAFTKHDL